MATCPTCKTTYPDTMRLCPTDGTVLEGGQAPKDDNVGRSLDGKYRLDERLSSGGMGTVYKATHLMLGKQLAVKLIKADLPASPDVVRRFQREAKAASALNHPNIAPAYDLGQTQDGTLYIAMEYVDGPSLKSVIQAGPIAPARTIVILKQVASALALAHKHEIIHRDLKPQNIMLTKDGDGREVAKLLDFGIAKTLDDTATQLTATGFSLGTPQYMSPEQAYGRQVDGRSDIYSLGIILYEMLVGEVPFSDPSTPAVLVKQMTEAPVPPELKRPDLKISPALAAVALKCLEKDPAKRYQNADEFSAALDRAAESLGATAVAAAQAANVPPADDAAAPTIVNRPAHSQTTRMPTPVPVPPPAASTGSGQTTAVNPGAPTPPAAPAPSGATTLVTPKAPAVDDKTLLAPQAAAAPAASAPAAASPVAPASSPAKPATPAPAAAAATSSGGGSRLAIAAGIAILLLGGAGYAAYEAGLFKLGGSSTATATNSTTPAPATQLASSGAPSTPAASPAPATPDPNAAASAAPASTPASAGAPPSGSTPTGGGGGNPAGGGSGGSNATPPAPPSTPPSAATPPPVPSTKSTSTHAAPAAAPATKSAATAAPAKGPGAGAASGASSSTTPAATSGATGAAHPQQSAPAPPPPAALPANPAVAFRCEGPGDICSALKSAIDQALAKDSMTSIRDPARADVALAGTVTLVDQQTQQMFGTTFTIKNYTIDVNGQARRGGDEVPMPSAATLNYDARYRDRLDEKARQVAASVVESVREYWKKK